MENFSVALVFIALIGFAAFQQYLRHHRRIMIHRERLAAVEKGIDLPPLERVEATMATTALGVAAGVDIVRVHDIRPNVRTARMADAIVRGTWRAP